MKLKVFLSVMLAFCMVAIVQAAPITITPVELGSTANVDSTDGGGSGGFLYTLIPDSTGNGVTFTNDDRTFVALYDSSGGAATITIHAPTSTLRTAFGDLSISDITISMESGNNNFALIHIPTRYNVSGKVTITTSDADYVKIGVYRLAKYGK